MLLKYFYIFVLNCVAELHDRKFFMNIEISTLEWQNSEFTCTSSDGEVGNLSVDDKPNSGCMCGLQ